MISDSLALIESTTILGRLETKTFLMFDFDAIILRA